MIVDLSELKFLRTFSFQAIKSGEVWGVVGDNGWLTTNHSTLPIWNATLFWTDPILAQESAGLCGRTKRVSLAEFVHELLPDFKESEHKIVLVCSKSERSGDLPVERVLEGFHRVARALKVALPEAPLAYSGDTIISRCTSFITFGVDSVKKADKPLAEEKMYAALGASLETPIESCCDYHSDVVANVQSHAFMAAVDLAYSEHRPLILTPDAVWLVIAQGLSQHIQNNAEALRERFVRHQGKVSLEIRCDDFVKGSPENPWDASIGDISALIRKHVGDENHGLFIADFSTTGPVERVASEIVMMEAFQHYFDIVAMGVCGFPEITLKGTVDDWIRIEQRVHKFEELGLGWWVERLKPICAEFVKAAQGRINLRHWRKLYKQIAVYGGTQFSGWVGELFPYTLGGSRNPIFEGESITIGSLPTGFSKAPFKWTIGQPPLTTTYYMEFVAGFCGVLQDKATLALQPKIGWAVREGDRLEQLLHQIETAHEFVPLNTEKESVYWHPFRAAAEMARFLDRCDGANLFIRDGKPWYRVLGTKSSYEMVFTRNKATNEYELLEAFDDGPGQPPADLRWAVVAESQNGEFFAMDTRERECIRTGEQTPRYSWPIVFGRSDEKIRPLSLRIVAYSMTELLDALLKNGMQPFVAAAECETVETMLNREL